MKRWSKLQKRLYSLIDPAIDFQIHCAVYRMNSNHGKTSMPRYFITIGKEIVWSYPNPKNVSVEEEFETGTYPHMNDASEISDLIEAYIQTPRARIVDKTFPEDRWGLIPILRSADRRISHKRRILTGEGETAQRDGK